MFVLEELKFYIHTQTLAELKELKIRASFKHLNAV